MWEYLTLPALQLLQHISPSQDITVWMLQEIKGQLTSEHARVTVSIKVPYISIHICEHRLGSWMSSCSSCWSACTIAFRCTKHLPARFFFFFLAVKTKPIPHIKKNLSQTNFKLKYLLWLFWHLRYILLLLAQLMNVCWDLQTTFVLKTTATYILTPMEVDARWQKVCNNSEFYFPFFYSLVFWNILKKYSASSAPPHPTFTKLGCVV